MPYQGLKICKNTLELVATNLNRYSNVVFSCDNPQLKRLVLRRIHGPVVLSFPGATLMYVEIVQCNLQSLYPL